MSRYYVNNRPQSTGEHEVHKTGCSYMPTDKKDLGEHSSCQSAVREAKKTYPNSDGCYYCIPECHTR
jgi:hypothetical protein